MSNNCHDCHICMQGPGLDSCHYPILQVSQVFSVVVPNSLLCGARFCDSRGTKFALTAYDSREILTFTKSQPQ